MAAALGHLRELRAGGDHPGHRLDGDTVLYECRADLVTWATGCGFSGRVAPFGGRAKLPFNVDWAAKWSLFGITLEGCGKDLATAGGSRDRSDAIARQVYRREPPINVRYEFINVGGKRMSTSRGTGVPAHEIAAVIRPTRCALFVRHRPNVSFEFDPDPHRCHPAPHGRVRPIGGGDRRPPRPRELPADADRIFSASLVDPEADAAAEAEVYRPALPTSPCSPSCRGSTSSNGSPPRRGQRSPSVSS